MPFMQGRAAIGRTLQHLQKGRILLKDNIRIMMFAFNTDFKTKTYPHHYGLRDFVLWHVPQIQYRNPNVQIITLDKLTPNPWIKVFYEDDKRLVVDCDSRTREEIHDHLLNVLSKEESEVNRLLQESESDVVDNVANFGAAYSRECMCEVPGQVPCPGWQPLPLEMTGKGRKILSEKAQEESAS